MLTINKRAFLGLMLAQGAAAILPAQSLAAGDRHLRLALATSPTSLDPHFHDSFTSTQALLQIYNTLLGQGPTGALIPGLATEWRALDEMTWEIKLRSGVKFHDGTPFEAEDIKFSFDRVPNVEGAIAPFTANVRGVTAIEVIDPSTVRFKINSPDPLFAYKLCQVCMLSRKIHANATTADFNSGKLAIGTGPYRYVSFSPGEKLELAANKEFWGGEPAWEQVSIRYVSEPGARIAALRAGEADLVDSVPVQDIPSLQADAGLTLFTTPAFLTVFLFPDTSRAQSPFVFDNAGHPLPKNPLQDLRVRQALSLAIDRQAIVSRLMAGQATVADQFAGLPVPDRAPDMKPLETDLKRAKELLAKAGYPDGFKMTVHGSSGWYSSDNQILQAVAQGLSRIGVTTEVEVMPPSMFGTRANNREFSMFQIYFNGPYALISLRFVAMTPDKAAGNGVSNRQHYSNAKVDDLMKQALVQMDDVKRLELIADAMREFISDLGIIPILFGKTSWVGRKGRLVYHANPMSRTSAFYADPT